MPRFGLSIISLVVLALVMTACGDTPPPSDSAEPDASGASPAESSAESEAPASEAPSTGAGRLADVRRAGSSSAASTAALPGFSFLDEATGEYTGFDVDFCRAVAAAVLGDPTRSSSAHVDTDQRGPLLQTGEIDVLIRNTTWTVSRDTAWGLFGPTTFYDGQGIMVNSTLTDATDDRRPRRRHDLRPVRHDDRAQPDRSARATASTSRRWSSRRSTRPTLPTRRAAATRSPATARSWSPAGRRSRTRTTT